MTTDTDDRWREGYARARTYYGDHLLRGARMSGGGSYAGGLTCDGFELARARAAHPETTTKEPHA